MTTKEQARAILDAGPNQLVRFKDHTDLARTVITQAEELDRLRADLAKAVGALQWQADQPEAHPFMAQHARATLSEITHD